MSPLQRVADLAPTLKEAELRVLLYLAARAEATRETVIAVSSRDLAEALHGSPSHTRAALQALAKRNLIATRQGTPSKPSVHQLNFLLTTSIGGSRADPPPASLADAPLGPERDRPRLFADAPPTESKGLARTDRRVESEGVLQLEGILDRRARASIKAYDPEIVASCRRWMHSYLLKFPDPQLREELDRGATVHPPDDKIVAQFLSMGDGVGGWPRLEALLQQLMIDRKPVYKYGWFLTVAMQRIHGITATVAKAHAERMKLVGHAPPPAAKPHAAPQQQSFPVDDVHQREQREQWTATLARTAAAKKLG